VERTVDVARACAFDLRLAAPNLPDLDVPAGHTDMSWLRELTRRGAVRYYPVTHPDHEQARHQLEYELGVIEQARLPGYFLLLVDIVEFCNRNDTTARGGERGEQRGLLRAGITKADAVALGLLFERFLSPSGTAPRHRPRHRAPTARGGHPVRLRQVRPRPCAQVANVITYRPKSALREMAKAVGVSHPGRPTRSRSGSTGGRDGSAFDGLTETRDAPAVPHSRSSSSNQVSTTAATSASIPAGW